MDDNQFQHALEAFQIAAREFNRQVAALAETLREPIDALAQQVKRTNDAIEKYVDMMVDERASIEQELDHDQIQPGAVGRVSMSWTQKEELRGQRVVVKQTLMDDSDPTVDPQLRFLVERVDRPGAVWNIPAVSFILEPVEAADD